MQVKKLFLCAMVSVMCLTGAVQAEEPSASSGAGRVLISGTAENAKTPYLTVSLIRSDADLENPKQTDIGYLRQYELGANGAYQITFDFADFIYGEDGKVENYSLYMHTGGESVIPAIAKAERKNLSLSAKVYVSQGATKASVIAEIENQKQTPALYSLIMACYDAKGALVGMVQEDNISSANKTETKYLDASLPEGTAEVRGFLWESVESMIPLYNGTTTEPIFGVYDFESDTASEDWFWVNGNAVYSVSSEEAYRGTKSGKLEGGNGAYLDSKQILSELYQLGNGAYRVTAYVKPKDKDAKIVPALQYKDASGSYFMSTGNASVVPAKKWTKIEATISVGLSGKESEARLQLMVAEGGNQAVYFDDISFVPAGNLTPVPEPEEKRVFIIGDSLCDKYGPNDLDQQGWSYYLRPEFIGGIPLNCATGGWSTNSFLYGHTANWGQFGERWSTYLDLMRPGDYVLVSLGTNDNSSKEGASERYRNNLSRMYEDVLKKGATMVFVTPCPLASEDSFNPDGTYRNDDRHTQLINIMKEFEGAVVLDMNAEMKQYLDTLRKEKVLSEIFLADRVHVKSAGAKKLSDILISLIKAEPRLSDLATMLK